MARKEIVMKSTSRMTKALLGRGLVFLLVFTSSVTSAQNCVPAPSGLINWWPGDGNADDIIGANNGVQVGDATFATGFVTSGNGQAFSFDGAGDYIQLPFDSGIFTNQFTIDAWVFPTKLLGFAFVQGIFDNDVSLNRGIVLGVFGGASDSFFPPPSVRPFQVTGAFHNSDGTQFSTGGIPSTPNQWNHYAITYDGSQLCLYQNGVQETCVPASGNVRDNNVNFRIGQGQFVVSESQRFFGGLIDEVEVFNRALTAAEISTIFNAGSEGKCKTGGNQPPEVICSVNVELLWPPNHNLIDVGLDFIVVDDTDPDPVVDVLVFADEDDEEPTGDGNHSPDASGEDETLRLRSERIGSSNGRVYLIVVRAQDAAGNVGFDCCTVVVPKSKSKKHIADVDAQATVAELLCLVDGLPPSGFVLVGEGPVIGPKQ